MNHWLTAPVLIPLLGGILQAFMGYAPISLRRTLALATTVLMLVSAIVLLVLADDGSFVLNIGGSWNPGTPTRSLYHYKLMIALVEDLGFHLAQECYWYNPAKMPVPAEWALRITPFPKAEPA